MSQNLAHLCALLIEDTYGPLYSHIFSALTTHGRLSAQELSHKCQLPVKQVIAGLATLVQCFLVFHHTAPDGRTSYQANTSIAFNLVRVGKFSQLMRHKFGHDGANIFNHLLLFGYDSLGNLQKVLVDERCLANGCGPDVEELPMADDSEQNPLVLIRGVLNRLVERGYLTELRLAHFQTLSDTRRAAETVVRTLGNLSSAKGKKAQEEFEEAVQAEVDRMLQGEEPLRALLAGTKRPLPEDTQVSVPKKQKRINGISSQAATLVAEFSTKVVDQIEGDTIFRIDHKKLLLLLKYQRIAHRVRKRMGSQSGQVMSALLRQCEAPLQKMGAPISETIFIKDLIVPIDIDQLLLDMTTSCNADSPENGRYGGLANGHLNGNLSHADFHILNKHELGAQVATLAEGCCDFVFQNKNSDNWMIDLNDAEHRLREDEIMQMVKRRFGPMSLRIIRILIDRGKVDEKALQEIGLVNAKDLRRCLARLNRYGFIDLQEVPREKERQPVRTIFLWFYDAERVRKRMLENLYKSMCRLLQRLKVERLKVGSTLQKAERSDVKGKEHEMLKADEVRVLKHWRRKELWYLAELGRLSDSVDVLQ